ncbi:small ribosomal subunit protein bTHXc-like [Coffea arabica]|uniref:Small ribosomal subunit protein bTHXc-like n=1 Tax=Coffea arabica TaxID=13443 RepID=A0ABM4WB66_COFAR
MASLLAGAVPMAASQTALCFPLSPSLSRPQPLLSSSSSSSSSSLSTSLSLSSPASSTLPFIYCGRGDKKAAKGKRFNHSFGNARPKDKKKGRGPPRVAVPPSPPRKDRYDDGEVVKIEIDESLG